MNESEFTCTRRSKILVKSNRHLVFQKLLQPRPIQNRTLRKLLQPPLPQSNPQKRLHQPPPPKP